MTDPLADADPLCRLSAAELARGYRRHALSPVEVTRACLARAETVQARCNAFSHIDHAGALAAADAAEARWRAGKPSSAIDGVPTTIKDIVHVAGWTVRYGSRALPGLDAPADAPAVRLLRQAGAVLLGLTTTPEFGWKAVTDGPLTGVTRNPHDTALTPGGSSGGAAAAAASGAGALHLGTDGGGSIRIPAAFCGVIGHKPTFGRVPAAPPSPFGTLAHIGPIARTPADAAAMLDAMSARDIRDWHQAPVPFPYPDPTPLSFRGQRIGVWRDPPGAVRGEAAIAQAFDAALQRLAAAGAVLDPVALPDEDLPELFRLHWFAGAAQRLRAVPEAARHAVDPGLRAVAAEGEAISLPQYLDAVLRRAAFGAAFEALFAGRDLIVSPAVAVPPFAAEREVPDGWPHERWTSWAGFSYPVNLAQAPACVVPCDGFRASLQFIAPRGADGRALAAAAGWLALG